MNQQQDDSENGFELVDKPKEGNLTDGPAPLPTWINPPTTLPINLISGPSALVLPAGQLFPNTSTPTAGNSQFFSSPAPVRFYKLLFRLCYSYKFHFSH